MSTNSLDLLEKLKYNSHLDKHKHFTAADRFKAYDKWTSLFIMLINFIIAVVHLITISSEMPHWLVYVISGLSFLAVLIAGIEIRSDFLKKFEAHRRSGDKHLSVARECEKNIVLFKDGLKPTNQMSKLLDKITSSYNEVNLVVIMR